MNEPIRRDHEELLESLVDGKLPRNLSWNSVVDLIGQIGEVQPHGNDEFVFAVGSQKGFFKRPAPIISKLRRSPGYAGSLKKPASLGSPPWHTK
jgi:hypothetical protein